MADPTTGEIQDTNLSYMIGPLGTNASPADKLCD